MEFTMRCPGISHGLGQSRASIPLKPLMGLADNANFWKTRNQLYE